MPTPPSSADAQAVLLANEAFYVAFDSRDLAAMDAIWQRVDAVSCTHPGWNPLHGRKQVMASWQAILDGAGAPRIRVRAPRVMLLGDAAVVVCFEQIEDGYLVATNVFRRTEAGWRIVHHQAGPAAAPPASGDDDGEQHGGGPGRVLN